MKRVLILTALLVAFPTAWADDTRKAREVEIVIPVNVRTEIYLERAKRKTAAKADRLIGKDTYTRALERRAAAKPRRYIPRKVKAKVREKD